ncbi:hypothetical protein D7V77_38430, partial [Corallococcus sp. CA041A]
MFSARNSLRIAGVREPPFAGGQPEHTLATHWRSREVACASCWGVWPSSWPCPPVARTRRRGGRRAR